MNAIKAAHPAVAKTAIRSLQSASDPVGIRLSLKPLTDLGVVDAMLQHDTIFEEAGRRGLGRELFIGLVEYACQDAHNIPRERDAFYVIRAPLTLLADQQLQEEMERTVEGGPLDRARICFEIPDTCYLVRPVLAGIHRLDAQGFKLSLAAFGSGFAPFEALSCLPVSFVQISPSFVGTMLHEPFAQELVRATNELGHLGGARTIAAGADTFDCVNLLRRMGVDYVEGPAI